MLLQNLTFLFALLYQVHAQVQAGQPFTLKVSMGVPAGMVVVTGANNSLILGEAGSPGAVFVGDKDVFDPPERPIQVILQQGTISMNGGGIYFEFDGTPFFGPLKYAAPGVDARTLGGVADGFEAAITNIDGSTYLRQRDGNPPGIKACDEDGTWYLRYGGAVHADLGPACSNVWLAFVPASNATAKSR